MSLYFGSVFEKLLEDKKQEIFTKIIELNNSFESIRNIQRDKYNKHNRDKHQCDKKDFDLIVDNIKDIQTKIMEYDNISNYISKIINIENESANLIFEIQSGFADIPDRVSRKEIMNLVVKLFE